MSHPESFETSENSEAVEQFLSDDQKRLIRETFAIAEPAMDQVAALFYNRLFELDPSLKELFKGDMVEQGRKLMSSLRVAVASLDKPDAILIMLKLLGRKHREYGVENSHYDTVAAALLWTLDQALEDKFTDETKEAWTRLYVYLAEGMTKQ